MDTKYDNNSFVLPVTRLRRRKQRSMFCVQAVARAVVIITHELHPWETTLIRQNYSEILTILIKLYQSCSHHDHMMSFTKKALKSLRFTELSRETEVLNMVTEIMNCIIEGLRLKTEIRHFLQNWVYCIYLQLNNQRNSS